MRKPVHESDERDPIERMLDTIETVLNRDSIKRVLGTIETALNRFATSMEVHLLPMLDRFMTAIEDRLGRAYGPR